MKQRPTSPEHEAVLPPKGRPLQLNSISSPLVSSPLDFPSRFWSFQASTVNLCVCVCVCVRARVCYVISTHTHTSCGPVSPENPDTASPKEWNFLNSLGTLKEFFIFFVS